MYREETTRKLISALIKTVSLDHQIQDRFFIRLLREKINRLLELYIEWARAGNNIVAQYNLQKDLCASIDSIVDIFQILLRLKLVSDAPLLDALKSCLELKLNIMQDQTDEASGVGLPLSHQITEKDSNLVVKRNRTRKKINIKQNVSDKKTALNKTERRIIDFITTADKLRIREIVDKFKQLSERTVKRNLSKLVKLGSLDRRTEGRVVFYTARASKGLHL